MYVRVTDRTLIDQTCVRFRRAGRERERVVGNTVLVYCIHMPYANKAIVCCCTCESVCTGVAAVPDGGISYLI